MIAFREHRLRRTRRAFSLIEIMIVLTIGSLVLGVMYQLFSSGVRGSTKGTDLVVAIREAHGLFSAIRKDVLGSLDMTSQMEMSPASITLSLSGTDLPDPNTTPYPDSLRFTFPNATVTYALKGTSPSTLYIERSREENGIFETKNFAVPRIKGFRTMLITKQQETAPEKNAFESRHLFVQIILQSTNKLQSNREISLQAFFTPSTLAMTTWNGWD